MRSTVSPTEFIDAWKAEHKAGGSPEGVSKRLKGRLTRGACVARAYTYRRKHDIKLPNFQGGGRGYDWDSIRKHANGSSGPAKKAKKAKAKKRAS